MKKEKISIIVCAYNTEQYISKCLDSLIHQSYQNLEIIVVNDCSKDATSKILEEYEKKYPLLNEERKLLFVLLSMPLKIEFTQDTFQTCNHITKELESLDKVSKMVHL